MSGRTLSAPSFRRKWGARDALQAAPTHGRRRFRRPRGVAQPGSASALGAEGRKFESCRPDQPALQETAMLARIYKPAKTAMQSGKARTREWVLEFEPS